MTVRTILPVLLVLAVVLSLLVPAPADARRRFEEGDWKAWPDTRAVVGFEVGRNVVYVVTTNGLLRYDRHEKKWLSPWLSVPGPLNQAIFLMHPLQALEDPLTQDLYVELEDGWVMRDHAARLWEPVEPPAGSVRERLFREPTLNATPDAGMITPFQYRVDLDDYTLHHRNEEWDFITGAATDWDIEIYAWTGYGLGVLDQYDPELQLFPQGTGPAPGLAVTDSSIWVAGELNYKGGWLWKRNRGGPEDKWHSFMPATVFGLSVGDVQAMHPDREGTVWIATDNGLMYGNGDRFHHLRKTDALPSDRIHDVQPLPGGAWIATRFGLAWISKASAEVTRPDKETYPELFGRPWGQLTADGDTLYAAGAGLLVKHVNGTTHWEQIPIESTIGNASEPLALWAEDGWIAVGDRQGLAWRSPDGDWQQVFNNRWNEGYIFAIDFHGGYFWLGTDRGLVKFDPKEGDAIVYSTDEGLPGNTVFEVIGEGDSLWLGTDVALVRFLWNAPGRLD